MHLYICSYKWITYDVTLKFDLSLLKSFLNPLLGWWVSFFVALKTIDFYAFKYKYRILYNCLLICVNNILYMYVINCECYYKL